ncbi:MAG: hypothetical protein ABJB74_13720 [Gemmatimonas sp.]
MGFESAYAARRRLALVAESNQFVQEAVLDGLAPARVEAVRVESGKPEAVCDVAAHLDQLAIEIMATPGAGGALLVAFAAQSRALSLVMEAARRTQNAAGLPTEVMLAVQNALRTPMPMGLELA